MSKKQQNKFDISKFEFLWDTILVQPIREETVNGLVRPEQYDDRPELGLVIATGAGKVLEDGTVLPMPIKAGDIIYYGKYASEATRMQGIDYLLIRAEDVRAVKR